MLIQNYINFVIQFLQHSFLKKFTFKNNNLYI